MPPREPHLGAAAARVTKPRGRRSTRPSDKAIAAAASAALMRDGCTMGKGAPAFGGAYGVGPGAPHPPPLALPVCGGAVENVNALNEGAQGEVVKHKRRLLARFQQDQAAERLGRAQVVHAHEELAGLEGGRQAAMRALMARCAREEERASAREDERRGERRDSDRRASLAAELPRYDSWASQAGQPKGGGTGRREEDADEAAVCDSCADDALTGVGADARGVGKRPQGETEGSMTRLPRLDCVLDTASGPSDIGAGSVPGAAPAPRTPASEATPPPAGVSPARVVPCEVEGHPATQRVDLALFRDVDTLLDGLERLFPAFLRDEMRLVYLDDDADCMLVSEHTPWSHFQTSVTKLMLISS